MAASPPQEKALMAKLVKRVVEFGKSPKVKISRRRCCAKLRAQDSGEDLEWC
jgi:hypothetical protein